MRTRRHVSAVGELPQASLADIAFLLLIFFIATTIFPMENGLSVVLPGTNLTPQPLLRENVLLIKAGEAGDVSVDGMPIAIAGIAAYAQDRLERNRELVVVIETHPDAPYHVLVDVLDEVKVAEAPTISIRMQKD